MADGGVERSRNEKLLLPDEKCRAFGFDRPTRKEQGDFVKTRWKSNLMDRPRPRPAPTKMLMSGVGTLPQIRELFWSRIKLSQIVHNNG